MSKNNPKLTDISVILLGVAAVAVIVVFSFVDVTLSQIPQINELAKDVIQRALLSLFLVVLCATSQYKTLLNFPVGNLGKQLLALLPCLAVAFANFPFSALIKGTATLQNFQYVWLFLIQCVLIGVVEELFFRGIVQDIVWQKTAKMSALWQTVICAAVFSLWHLVNLLFGQGFGTTMLQVGYTFLIGAMLTVLRLATNNIWLCVAVHALFDFGGNIVNTLGSGNVWDVPFWIATVVCGVICGIWAIVFLVKFDKNKSATAVLNKVPNTDVTDNAEQA